MATDPFPILQLKTTTPVELARPIGQRIFKVHNVPAEQFEGHLQNLDKWRRDICNVSTGKMPIAESTIQTTFLPYLVLFDQCQSKVDIAPSFQWGSTKAKNCYLELAAVAFNAGIASTLIPTTDLKAKFKNFQQAAAFFEICRVQFVKNPVFAEIKHNTGDLTIDCLVVLRDMMLAMAHHCAYITAVAEGKLKPPMLAKLAMESVAMYTTLLPEMERPAVSSYLDKQLIKHAAYFKVFLHIQAQVHTCDSLQEEKEIGMAIARMNFVQELMQQLPHHGKVEKDKIFASYNADLHKRMESLEKDNRLVYHMKVPATATLSEIPRLGRSMAALPDIATILPSDQENPFASLVPESVIQKVATFDQEMSDDMRKKSKPVTNLTKQARNTVSSSGAMGVVASDLASNNTGTTPLPPPLKQKVDGILNSTAHAGGPDQCLLQWVDSLEQLARVARSSTSMSQTLLVAEEEEDKDVRQKIGVFNRAHSKDAAQMMQQTLDDQLRRMTEAAGGDAIVKEKLAQYKDKLANLAQCVEALEKNIYAEKAAATQEESPVMNTLSQGTQELKDMLQRFEEMDAEVSQVFVSFDDRMAVLKTELTSKLASTTSKAAEDDVLEQMAGPIRKEIEGLMAKAEQLHELANQIGSKATELAQMRKNHDSQAAQDSTKYYTDAIRELDGNCNMFTEISLNIKEGLNFWAQTSDAAARLEQKIQDWVVARRYEKEAILSQMSAQASGAQAIRQSEELIRQMAERGEIKYP